MKKTIEFLSELSENNNREWFNANKERYREVQSEVNAMTERLIERIGDFEPNIRGLAVSDCSYRIYRDTRFSPDKTPYKTHIGTYICQGGKKSGYAGYYLHIDPAGSLLAVGLHCPSPAVLKSVREEIFTNGEAFRRTIAESGFRVDESTKLKRPPKGYAPDNEYIEYLKLKDFDLRKDVDVERADLVEYAAEQFCRCKPFNDILNQAISFAFENPNAL